MTAMLNPESPPHTGDLAGTPAFANMRRDSDPGSSMRVSETEHDQDSTTANNSAVDGTGLGLGIGVAIGSAEHLEPQKVVRSPLVFFLLENFGLNLFLEESARVLEPVTERPFA